MIHSLNFLYIKAKVIKITDGTMTKAASYDKLSISEQ